MAIPRISTAIVVTCRLWGLIPRSPWKYARDNRTDINLIAQDQNAWDWLKNPSSDSKTYGRPIQNLGGSPPRFLETAGNHQRAIFVRKKEIDIPQGLPSDSPPVVLVFAANPTRPSVIKTVVAGAVRSMSAHLIPATSTLKDHSDILSVISRLESETNSAQAFRTWTGIPPPVFAGVGTNFPNLPLPDLSF